MLVPIIDIPAAARVDTFFAPPHRTRPPDLRNGHLMPPDLRTLHEALWRQEHGPEEVVASVLCEVYVEGPGLVFDRDLNLIRQTINQASEPEIEASYASVQEAARQGPPRLSPGVTLLCERSGIGNYGHWLVEMLPVAILNLKHLADGGWRMAAASAGGRGPDEPGSARFDPPGRRTG